MSIVNFIFILILGFVFVNYAVKSAESKDIFMKYIGGIESRLDSLREAVEKLEHLQETDYQNAMNSLYNLSNDINRAKMRLARIEQENIKKDAKSMTTPATISNEDLLKQMGKAVGVK